MRHTKHAFDKHSCFYWGSTHLSSAHTKHVFGHGLQPVKGQLQADVEEQEHHTQLSQVLHTLRARVAVN